MLEQSNFCGIICEFNPLHFGHREILSRAEAMAPVVCVMSGNFVQRGEPAIVDKWQRTYSALENGADLVIELPLPWACSGAEHFAYGAVKLLDSLGISGSLLFGSESGDISLLSETASLLTSEHFKNRLNQELKSEKASFASIREKTLCTHFGKQYADILRKPNNILAVEYLKAIQIISAPLTPFTLSRIGAGHDESASAGEFMSASEIRKYIHNHKSIDGLLPENVLLRLKKSINLLEAPHNFAFLERAVLAKLRSMTVKEFSALPDISEGLEYKLFSSVKKATSIEELYDLVKSKRYSHARIRRLILSAFLGLNKNLPKNPPYIRILGMTKTGEALLKKCKPTVPFAIRPSDFERLGGEIKELFVLEAKADDLYALSAPKIGPCGMDYTQPIIRME